MTKQISTIKNPLTVIAIFAGIAEVSGSAVLPFISETNQQTYIWFLMLFPFALITLFFMILNWNHKVLYAPSDFEDEDNFVNILQKSSVREKIAEYEEEFVELESDEVDNSSFSEEEEPPEEADITLAEPDTISQPISSIAENIESLSVNSPVITTKTERDRRATLLKAAFQQSQNENRLIEKLLIERLEKELNTSIETDIKMEFGSTRYLLDGVARKGSNLTAIEIKIWRDMTIQSEGMVIRNINQIEGLYDSLTEEQRNDFSLIFAVVTDHSNPKLIERLKMRFNKLSFPVAVQVYDTDLITSEVLRNAS